MDNRAETLAGLAGLFVDPGRIHGADDLATDAARAVEDPSHEPAFAAVAAMLGLFEGLAPEPLPVLTGP